MQKPSIQFIKKWLVKMIKFLKKLFKPSNPIEDYLAESEDLVELERRQRDLQRKGIWI